MGAFLDDVSIKQDTTQTGRADSRTAFGDIKGGAMEFYFGGINDSPTPKQFWYSLAAIGLIAWGFYYFVFRKKA